MAEKRTIELEIKENFKQVEKDLNSLDKALDNTADSARDVNKSFEDVYGDLQPLTARMGEAEDRLYELAAAGDYTSNEYKNLLNTVGEYRRVQINTDLAVDAASMTLSQKLGGALGGVASGFELAQGSMALFGFEGENVQAALLKVQSAMALSQGLQGLKEAKTSFIALGDSVKKTAVGQAILTAATAAYTFVTTASTTGLKLFRIALISTGIGLLIVGIGLLIANFEKVLALFGPLIQGFKDFGDWIGLTSFKQDEEDKKAFKRAENRIAEINREKVAREKAQKAKETAYNNEDKALGRQIDLMKAQGKDTTALERARLKATINYQTNLQNETFAIFNQNKEKNKLILTELRAIAVREKDFTEYNKFLLSTSASQNELAAQNAAANEARKDAINALAIFEEETRKNAASSASNTNSQTTKNDVKTAVEKLDISRKLKDDELRILEDGFDKEMSLLNEKRKREKEDADKQFKDGVLKKEDYNKLLASIDSTYEADRKKIYEKDTAEQIKTRDFTIQNLIDTKTKEVEIENEAYLKKKEIKDKESEEDIARQQRLNELRFNAAKNTLQVISNVTELFAGKSKAQQKKAFQIQKAVNIAGATMDTYKAASSALKDSPAPFNFIAMAAVITAGLLNVKKIASQKFEGGGSSGGGGGTGGGGAAPITPQFNTVGNNGINQLAQLQQQPVQAYVVSGEVTSQQSLDRNRAQNSSL